jgi:hypothetical protein
VKKFLFAALALAAAAIMAGTVLAAQPSGAGAGKAPLFDSPTYTPGVTCPNGADDTTGPAFGFVVLNTNGNGGLSAQVSVKGGTPNSTYDIWVNQDPGTCPLGVATAPGALTTNGQGNGNAHVTLPRVAGATNFWISAVGATQVLRSTAVTLD